MPVYVDMDGWPTLVVDFVGNCTDDEWRAAAAEVFRHVATGEPVAIVCDGTTLRGLPTPTQVRIAAELNTALRRGGHVNIVGWANVAPSRLLRTAISGINWLSPAPFPICHLAERAGALRWTRTLLDAALAGPHGVELGRAQ